MSFEWFLAAELDRATTTVELAHAPNRLLHATFTWMGMIAAMHARTCADQDIADEERA